MNIKIFWLAGLITALLSPMVVAGGPRRKRSADAAALSNEASAARATRSAQPAVAANPIDSPPPAIPAAASIPAEPSDESSNDDDVPSQAPLAAPPAPEPSEEPTSDDDALSQAPLAVPPAAAPAAAAPAAAASQAPPPLPVLGNTFVPRRIGTRIKNPVRGATSPEFRRAVKMDYDPGHWSAGLTRPEAIKLAGEAANAVKKILLDSRLKHKKSGYEGMTSRAQDFRSLFDMITNGDHLSPQDSDRAFEIKFNPVLNAWEHDFEELWNWFMYFFWEAFLLSSGLWDEHGKFKYQRKDDDEDDGGGKGSYGQHWDISSNVPSRPKSTVNTT